ncbi:MAG: hypothetical protein ACE5ET_04360 [Gammaproteobacteria bacterium]
MRVLFLLLLLLNVAFFAWYSRHPLETPPVQQAAEGGGIVLLQERSASSAIAAVLPSLPPLPVLCYQVGPFAEAPQGEQFVAALTPVPEHYEVQAHEEKVHSGYWVRWPQVLALAEARRIYRELQEKGVRDVAITPAGKGRYIVSLGVFRHRDTMEERHNRLIALGYAVQVEDRFRPLARSWLFLEFRRHTAPEVAAALQGVQQQFPAVGVEKVKCP